MDDTEDDARYPPNPYSANYRQSYGSSHRSKLAARNSSYSEQVGNEYDDEEEEEEEEEKEEEEEEETEEEEEQEEEEEEENGVQRVEEEADEEQEQEQEDDDDDEDNNNDDVEDGGIYCRRIEDGKDSESHRKKRKLKSLSSGYEFAPRVAALSGAAMAAPKSSFGGRNSPADWSEHATFVLLDAWGDRFLQLGRKSLRSDEWVEVAEKVSQSSKTVRTDTQCRNRLDTLKKKYKKEKMKLGEMINSTCKWVYFKKMDMLMNASPRQPGLSCGLDSGGYVFMKPRVYLNHSNGLDEMRDIPGSSESSDGDGDEDEDNSDGLPPKKTRFKENGVERSSFRLLADSIQKFGEIYEKIENNRRQQMLELEKMRMEFRRDLEMQKRKILERAQAEIAKIRQEDDEEIGVSIENMSE